MFICDCTNIHKNVLLLRKGTPATPATPANIVQSLPDWASQISNTDTVAAVAQILQSPQGQQVRLLIHWKHCVLCTAVFLTGVYVCVCSCSSWFRACRCSSRSLSRLCCRRWMQVWWCSCRPWPHSSLRPQQPTRSTRWNRGFPPLTRSETWFNPCITLSIVKYLFSYWPFCGVVEAVGSVRFREWVGTQRGFQERFYVISVVCSSFAIFKKKAVPCGVYFLSHALTVSLRPVVSDSINSSIFHQLAEHLQQQNLEQFQKQLMEHQQHQQKVLKIMILSLHNVLEL